MRRALTVLVALTLQASAALPTERRQPRDRMATMQRWLRRWEGAAVEVVAVGGASLLWDGRVRRAAAVATVLGSVTFRCSLVRQPMNDAATLRRTVGGFGRTCGAVVFQCLGSCSNLRRGPVRPRGRPSPLLEAVHRRGLRPCSVHLDKKSWSALGAAHAAFTIGQAAPPACYVKTRRAAQGRLVGPAGSAAWRGGGRRSRLRSSSRSRRGWS